MSPDDMLGMDMATELPHLKSENLPRKHEQLKSFLSVHGQIQACGACLKSRQMGGTEACPMSTMIDCVNIVEWADKVVTF
jgi:hypothetical protein